MNKLIVKQVGNVTMLQEVELAYTSPQGDLRTVKVLRQRRATPNEVLMYHAGFGALLRYEVPPLSARLAARCSR